MSGGAPLPPVVVGTAAAEISTPAVASNGIDYLAVWAQPPHCVVDPCYVTEMPLKAQRLRADGTAIDPLPIEVQGGAGRSAWEPSVAWNGGRYVAVWGEHSTTSLDIHAASITPEGAVGDLDASGHGVIVATGRGAAKIMPFLNGFALVTWGGGPPTEGTAFCGTCDLKTVPSLPRTTLFDNSGVSQNSIDVAGTGGTIIAAYTRREPAAGYVDRAFARSYVWIPARRRAAVH